MMHVISVLMGMRDCFVRMRVRVLPLDEGGVNVGVMPIIMSVRVLVLCFPVVVRVFVPLREVKRHACAKEDSRERCAPAELSGYDGQPHRSPCAARRPRDEATWYQPKANGIPTAGTATIQARAWEAVPA